jgi:kinesin family protein 4/21/27
MNTAFPPFIKLLLLANVAVFVVENLFVFECEKAEDALELLKLGSKNRVLASHNLNDLSSRSHTIFCLTIESQDIAK